MPVWFAMYTTLQTAVEMYHTHFLWFTDLSAPDQLFGPMHIPLVGAMPALGPLPFILGAFMILQQRIVPQQGMDPMQQKMMTYIMPCGLHVMMLFLPAALGVYMLTNSVLGIVQQLLVEKFAPREAAAKKKEIEVTEKAKINRQDGVARKGTKPVSETDQTPGADESTLDEQSKRALGFLRNLRRQDADEGRGASSPRTTARAKRTRSASRSKDPTRAASSASAARCSRPSST